MYNKYLIFILLILITILAILSINIDSDNNDDLYDHDEYDLITDSLDDDFDIVNQPVQNNYNMRDSYDEPFSNVRLKERVENQWDATTYWLNRTNRLANGHRHYGTRSHRNLKRNNREVREKINDITKRANINHSLGKLNKLNDNINDTVNAIKKETELGQK